MHKKDLHDNTKDILSQDIFTKFHELGLSQKEAYFKDRYGTVHGTTGFFDTWFTQSLVDFKSFTINQNIIDVCIATNGTRTEGGGSSSDSTANTIIIHINNKKGDITKTCYSNNTSHKNDTFNKILDCKYDGQIIKITISDGDGKEQTFLFNEDELQTWEINKDLLDKLWLPTELLIDDIVIQTKETLEHTLTNTKEATYDMIITGRQYIQDTQSGISNDKTQSILGPLFTNDYDINTIPNDLIEAYLGSLDMSAFIGLVAKISDQHLKTKLCYKRLKQTGMPYGDDKIEKWEQDALPLCQLGEIDILSYIQDCFLEKDWGYYIYNALDLIDYYHLNIDIVVPHIKACLIKNHIPKIGWNYSDTNKLQAIDRLFSYVATYEGVDTDTFKKQLIIDWIKNTPSSQMTQKLIYALDYNLEHTIYDSILDNYFSGYTIDNYIYNYDDRKRIKDLIATIISIYEKISRPIPLSVLPIMIHIAGEGESIDLIQQFLQKQIKHHNAIDTVYNIMLNKPNKNLDFYISLGANDTNIITQYIKNYILPGKNISSKLDNCIATLESNGLFMPNIKEIFTNFFSTFFISEDVRAGSNSFDGYYYAYTRYAGYISQDIFNTWINKMITYSQANHNSKGSVAYIFKAMLTRGYTTTDIENFIIQYKVKQKEVFNNLLKHAIQYVDKRFIHTIIQELYNTCTKESLEQAKEITEQCNFAPVRGKKIDIAILEHEYCTPYTGECIIKSYSLPSSYKDHIIKIYLKGNELVEALLYAGKHNIIITPTLYQYYENHNQQRKDAIAKIKKEREEKEQQDKKERIYKALLYNDAIEHNNYETIIDYKDSQKYIFLQNNEGKLIIASKPLEYHRDILASIGGKKEHVIGGGRIDIDNNTKNIILDGTSGDFGKIHEEYYNIVIQILQNTYTDYTISFKK